MDSRRQFQCSLYPFLLPLDMEDQNRAMITIRGWSGNLSGDPSAARAMNQQELLQLADSGLIELGAHTRHHPMLLRLSLKKRKNEIDSKKGIWRNYWENKLRG